MRTILAISITLAVACTTAHAADGDVVVEELPRPFERIYGKRWREKASVHDLQAYEGLLYVAHGSTNTRVRQQALFFDPAANDFDVARDDDGKPLTFRTEDVRWLRVLGDALYLVDYDPIDDPAIGIRKTPASGWETFDVGPDAHNRDMAVSGKRLFTHHGHNRAPWPFVRWSGDGGRTWADVENRDVYDGPEGGPGYEFFTFRGRLYSTAAGMRITRESAAAIRGQIVSESASTTRPARTTSRVDLTTRPAVSFEPSAAPYMIRLADGAGPPRFEVVHSTVNAFLTTPELRKEIFSAYVTRAVEHGGQLYFLIGARAFVARSIDPPDVTALPLAAAERAIDQVVVGDAVWQLRARQHGDGYDVTIVRSRDGQKWDRVLSFPSASWPLCFEHLKGHLYFAFPDGRFARIGI